MTIPRLPTRYTVDRELGRGGMAVVYLARDRQHDRPVAVKVLRADVAAGDATARFLREIRIAAGLQHPLIVGLIDSGVTEPPEPVPYYVMPFVDGESLRALLTRTGPLTVADALRIAREVGEALSFAHRAGVVHRDVKPENIIMAAGHALVADFGIAFAARALDNESHQRLTQFGIQLGTPAYMSPEQAAGDVVIDARSDQYSLACLVYELIAGRPPFVAATVAATIAQHFVVPPTPLDVLRATTPPSIVSAVDRALSKSPDERFDAISQFIDALASPVFTPMRSERSLAVLPFANLSPDAENEYFSDGLTDEVVSDLSALRNLRVISRTSAMRYKGTTAPLSAIARDLGVRYLVEGSVRKSGRQLRVTAKLLDGTTDACLWSHTFSGTTDDVFAVQEQISREIAKALAFTLSAAEDLRLSDRPIADPHAFDLYLQARALLWRFDRSSGNTAINLIDQALAIEGENAALLAVKGYVLIRGLTGETMSDAARSEAAAIAERLVGMAPDSAHGHFLVGMIAFHAGDLQVQYDRLKLALSRDRHHTEALAWMANACLHAGRLDACRILGEQLKATDPLSGWGWCFEGFADLFAGQFDSGVAMMARAVKLQPDGMFPRWQYGYALALNGELGAASRIADVLETVDRTSPYSIQLRALITGLTGRQEDAREQLASLAAIEFDGHLTFHLAESHAVAGDADTTVALLACAVATGFYPYAYIARHCSFLSAVRETPGMAEVLAEAERRSNAFRV